MSVWEELKRSVDQNAKAEGQCELIMNSLLAQENLNNAVVDKVASVLGKWGNTSPEALEKELEDFQSQKLMTCSDRSVGANVSDAGGQGIKKLVGVKEMASILGVTENWIYQRTRLNKIPHKKVGKYIKFDPVEVLAFFEEEQRKGE